MRTVIAYACAGLLLFHSGVAQCFTPAQFTAQYRQILLKPFSEQHKPLLAWQKHWEQCQFVPDSIYVGSLLQIGQGYHALNHLSDAVRVVAQAIKVCRSHPNTTRTGDLSKAWYRLGVLYTYQNKIQPAINALKQAVKVGGYDKLSANWVGNAHLYLAYAYVTAEDYQQVLTHAHAGIPIAGRLSNKPLMANLFRQKAHALRALQRYDEAQFAIIHAISLIKGETGLQQALADDYSVLSLILGYKNQYKKALAYAKLSYEIACRTQHYEIPNLAIRLGYLYNKVNEYQNAIWYCQYGISHAIDDFGRATGYNILGTIYWQQKQFNKALACYQRGIRTLPIKFRKQSVWANPEKDQIRLIVHKGILLAVLQDKADTWLDSAKAANNRQCLQYALDTYRVADQLIDYMRWEHTGQQSKLHWRNKTRGMYERAIETCYLLGDTARAFRFFEKSRAVMLTDKLNELGARQQLTPGQIAEERKLRQAVNQQQAKLADPKLVNQARATVQSALLIEQDKLDAFRKQLEITNPAYYHYKYDNTIPPLADLQRYLKTQHASFVTYFEGDSALYVLGVTGDKATLKRQSVGKYTRTIRQFMPLLANPEAMNRTATVVQFRTLGNDLYQQLLAPLSVPAGRVIVSPDGSFIPFETLSRSPSKSDYLVKIYAFSYAYSAHLLLKKDTLSTQTAGFVTGDFLGVAPVTFASALGQATLSGSDDALKPIAARFGSSTLLTHEAATRGAFQSAVSAYRVIHLFTHATADSTGQEPTLYFADSTLRLSDLGDGALPNAQLVVLAACKTGIGAIQRGEGVFSLARGFSALGVPSVLTTLWSVQNDATYRLTDSFYSYLDQGLPKDVALQQAKRDWLATAEGANQLPNYWAGLILIGDTKPLDRPVRWPWVAGGMLLLLGTGATGLWWLRRRATPVVSYLRPA